MVSLFYPDTITHRARPRDVVKLPPRGSLIHRHTLNTYLGNFPGGPEVKNLPSTAVDEGSIPGEGTKVPHAPEQLSPCPRNY